MRGAPYTMIDQCGRSIIDLTHFPQLWKTLNSCPSLIFPVGLTELSTEIVADLNFFLWPTLLPHFPSPVNPLHGNFHHRICFLESPQGQLVLVVIWWTRDRTLELNCLLFGWQWPHHRQELEYRWLLAQSTIVIVKTFTWRGVLLEGIALDGLIYRVYERGRVKCS